MKSFTVTIEHTVVTRQIVDVEAATKHDASFAAHAKIDPEAWDEVSESDRVVSVDKAE